GWPRPDPPPGPLASGLCGDGNGCKPAPRPRSVPDLPSAPPGPSRGPRTVGSLKAFAGASRTLLGAEVREFLDLRLDLFDLPLELRPDPLEPPFSLQPVDGRAFQELLGPSDLGPIARLDAAETFQLPFDLVRRRNVSALPWPARGPSETLGRGPFAGDDHVEDAIGIRVLQRVAVRVLRQVHDREVGAVAIPLDQELVRVQPDPHALPLDARHLGRQEDGRIGEDHVDEGIPRPDLLSLERGAGSLQPRLPRTRGKAVDEGLPKDAELAFERILQHALNGPPGLLKLVLNAHGGIPGLRSE